MSEPPTTALLATTVGRYRVVRLIAHGGMGSLYLARDPAIDRPVAIKLLQEGFDDEAARVRFAREARATGGLRHPNIVTVFDVGEHDKRPFIAMEYVPGETLAQLLRRRAPLSLNEQLAIVEDICTGLQFAHAAGIIHRDIKPANVMLDVSGTVKILDFGLARAADSGITKSGEQLGTLNYMSPEQVVGGHLDHRSDVYTVGALAYELISREKAFPGTVQDGVMYRILSVDPSPLESLVPGIDPEIPKIVERAMAKEPSQRYHTLDRLREDLVAVRVRLTGLESSDHLNLEDDAEPAVDPSGTARYSHPAAPGSGKAPGRPPMVGVARDSSIGEREAIMSSAQTMSSLEKAAAEASPGSRAMPRRSRLIGLLGAAAVTLMILGVAFYQFRPRVQPQRTDAEQPTPSQLPAPAPTLPVDSSVSQNRGDDRLGIDERLRVIRATAQSQIAGGQHQQALDTLSAGLVLQAGDPDLNSMLDELKRAARQAMIQARTAASRRGAIERSPLEFQEARARESKADSLDRAGDRTQAVRAFWEAAELYDRASRVTSQGAAPMPPASATPPRPEIPRTETLAPPPERPPVAPNPPPPLPAPPVATQPSPQPPGPVKADPVPRSSGEASPEGRTGDLAAIEATLRRYAAAYQDRDAAAVRTVLPSLSDQQLRNLEKDFASYRSYSVEIADQRIAVNPDAVTATATAQVRRSFVSKNGVAGGHTVATVFRLRKTDGAWVIDRLESP